MDRQPEGPDEIQGSLQALPRLGLAGLGHGDGGIGHDYTCRQSGPELPRAGADEARGIEIASARRIRPGALHAVPGALLQLDNGHDRRPGSRRDGASVHRPGQQVQGCRCPKSERRQLKAWARGAAKARPQWSLELEYARDFGLDPDRFEPSVARWFQWLEWRAAQASQEAWAFTRQDEDWSEHITPEQQAAYDWALTDIVDE